MKLGMVGLGRMGSGMTERLRLGGHEVQTYDPQKESTASSLEELASQLEPPRVLWMMIPAGEITESAFKELVGILERGDVIVDGGNSNFHDSQRRNAEAAEKGIDFLDVGVSGGIWGLKEGYCLMAGGPDKAVGLLTPALETLAPADGWAHVGPSGAGHFVKMVHNGIEYGLMQAYAEGFEIMHASEFDLDLEQISGIWRYGSVVRSWLLELLHDAIGEHGNDLADIADYVEDSGEGRWTVFEAINESVPAPAITLALFTRFASRQDESFAAKINAAPRAEFGGHPVKRKNP
jgi:6-phosphogluconate dehydrogenase